MRFFIGIEDLAANALIEVLSTKNRRFLTYQEVEAYGNKVVEILNVDEEKAVLILSRNNTNAMFSDYSDFFEEREQEGQRGIYLKENKTAEDLITRFRGYLALDVLLAFVDQRSLQVLGLLYESETAKGPAVWLHCHSGGYHERCCGHRGFSASPTYHTDELQPTLLLCGT